MSFVPEVQPPLAPSRATAAAPLAIVADDEPLGRNVTLAFLHRLGIEAIGVADGGAFLETFERRAFECDAVVLDSRMPGPPLDELVRRVRARVPGLPVIVATGDVPGARARVDDPGVIFLEKPFRPSELADALEGARPLRGVA